MKISAFRFTLISAIIIDMVIGYRVFAQCDEISSNFQRYQLSHSLNLDPLEGVWKAYRTVKVFQKNQLKRIKKDEKAQSWAILRDHQNFIVCFGSKKVDEPTFYFTKQDSANYIFYKNYINEKTFVSAFAYLNEEKVTFKFYESNSYLKNLLGSKFNPDVTVEYEYELIREDNYSSKLVKQVPKIKEFIIDGVKNYFNL